MRIGLTGGIGSGKSTVAVFLGQAGATVIDTDAIARELTSASGAAMAMIAREFGAELLTFDGSLDRGRMRELVFSDVTARRRLEAILHPLIIERCQLQEAAANTALVVFDVPLLVESARWRSRVNRVLVVDCEEQTQLSRVLQRPGWSGAAAAAVLQAQAGRAARRACADAVLYNDGLSLAELHAQVISLCGRWAASETMAVKQCTITADRQG